MKKTDSLLAIIMMFFMVIAILITSFQIAIYGDSEYKFYQKLYEKYTVLEDLNMEMDDVMEVTDYMMAYLIGEEEELSIVTNVDGREQDFFNEQDRLHMLDVKNLFLGGLELRTHCLIAAAILLGVLILKKANLRPLIPKAYATALGIFLGIVVFLAIAFTIDFTACFTIFHKIFFTNDLWLFDPATDYMIRMLPEGFFASMVVRIVAIFVGILFLIMFFIFVWKHFDKKNKNNL
ncbi:MAG: TIGR01906 family membrane protein [Dorea sp.]